MPVPTCFRYAAIVSQNSVSRNTRSVNVIMPVEKRRGVQAVLRMRNVINGKVRYLVIFV